MAIKRLGDDCGIDDLVFQATNNIMSETRTLVYQIMGYDTELIDINIDVEEISNMATDLISDAVFRVASRKEDRPKSQWNIRMSIHD